MRWVVIFVVALFVPTAAGLAIGISEGQVEGSAVADEPADAEAAGESVMLFEDPQGDAKEWPADHAARQAAAVPCWGLALGEGPAAPVCHEAHSQVNSLGPAGGVPADPAFDLLEAAAVVSEDEITFTISVAELPEDVRELDPLGTSPRNIWFVVLGFADGELAGLLIDMDIARSTDEPHIQYSYDQFCTADGSADPWTCETGCNYWWWCPNLVDGEMEPGSPGRFVVHVPWEVIGRNASSMRFDEVSATVRHTDHVLLPADPYALPAYRDGPFGLQAHPDRFGRGTQAPDYAVGGPVQLPIVAASPKPLPSHVDTRVGDAPAHVDIQSVRFLEEADRLGFETTLGHVDAEPGNEVLYLAAGTPNGRVADVWFDVIDNERRPVAFLPLDVNYTDYVQIPVEMAVQPGTPGTVTFWFDRASFGDLEAGELMQLVMASSGESSGRQTLADLGALGTAYDRTPDNPAYDYIPGGAFALQWSSVGDVEAPEPVIVDDLFEDETDWASPLPTWDDDLRARFDIWSVYANPLDESTTQMSVRMRNLDSVEVPTGFNAFAYIVSASSVHGEFMAGYYKHETGAQQFFCAQDTVGFTPEVQDPRHAVWQTIQGTYVLSDTPSGQATGTPSGGIEMTVPHSCLGIDTDGPVEVPELVAKTVLLRDPVPNAPAGNDVVPADEAASDGPVTVGMMASDEATVAQGPWYAAPLGVQNFWDIAGVTFAILAALLGALLIRRRRRHLSNYLKQIDDAGHIRGARKREAELAKIGQAIDEDAQRGRLTDGQFAVLERRLAAALGRARMDSLSGELGDLPYGIVSELEHVLKDGSVTQREFNIVEALVDKAGLPTTQRKRVLGRIRSWAEI